MHHSSRVVRRLSKWKSKRAKATRYAPSHMLLADTATAHLTYRTRRMANQITAIIILRHLERK